MNNADELVAKADQMVKQGQAQGSASFAGSSFDVGAISSDDLAPVAPAVLAQPKGATAATGLLGSIEANQEINQEAQKFAQETVKIDKGLQGDVNAARSGLFERLFGKKGETQATSEAYAEEVDPAKKELNEIQNQIRAKDHAYRRQIEKIQKNEKGQFFGGAEQDIATIERQAASELADLSIIEQAKLANYSTAKEIADRKVAAETEKDQNEIEALKFWYTENKSDLTDKEDKQFNLMIGERERLLGDQKETKKTVSELAIEALKNGADQATAQSILSSSTVGEAIGAAGSYIGLLERQKAAREAEIQNAAGVLATLPVSIQGKVISIATDFGSTDVVKKYNATVDGLNLVNGIDATTTNPSDHQTMVYAFAKSLDPESVVREGEYETIKKYAQSSVKKYGKEITNALNGSGFLSQEAIDNIKQTMQNNYDSRKPAYDNLRAQKTKVINNIAGKDVASEIMIDYSGGLGGSQSPESEEQQLLNQGYTQEQIDQIKNSK